MYYLLYVHRMAPTKMFRFLWVNLNAKFFPVFFSILPKFRYFPTGKYREIPKIRENTEINLKSSPRSKYRPLGASCVWLQLLIGVDPSAASEPPRRRARSAVICAGVLEGRCTVCAPLGRTVWYYVGLSISIPELAKGDDVRVSTTTPVPIIRLSNNPYCCTGVIGAGWAASQGRKKEGRHRKMSS